MSVSPTVTLGMALLWGWGGLRSRVLIRRSRAASATGASAPARTCSQWWQATACPASIGASGGVSVLQICVASGQRVWKRQAGGGLRGLGISPGTSSLRRSRRVGSGSEIAESSPTRVRDAAVR